MSTRLQPSLTGHDRGEHTGDVKAGGRDGDAQRVERATAVLLAVSQTLIGWDSFDAASERLLRDLAGALGMGAGAVWLPAGEELVPRSTWGASAKMLKELARFLRPQRPGRGDGLAGLAWQRREPVYAAPWGPEDDGAAAHDGAGRLRAQLAMPAGAGEDVLGVVELYSTSRLESSGELLDVLATAGQLLGLVFDRRRGELRLSPLTVRELQVLTLAATGLTGRAIAADLEISPATVKTHFEHIFRKLGVGDRTAAVADAIRGGLIG
jgi:DNA-binding CsgD family transcriptional regulator